MVGSGIRDPDPGSGKNPFRIPDPGVQKAPDHGSRIRNTGKKGGLYHSIFLPDPGSVADPKQKFRIRFRIRIRLGVSFGSRSGFES